MTYVCYEKKYNLQIMKKTVIILRNMLLQRFEYKQNSDSTTTSKKFVIYECSRKFNTKLNYQVSFEISS